ncbi:MAG: hypothetical protein WD356_08285 [Pseudomonadales bacterium]
MDNQRLQQENGQFCNTQGVSENNRALGFLPAFQDTVTGRIVLSTHENGTPAELHIIAWLPPEWAAQVDGRGRVLSLRPGIVAGFVRKGVFYTREEAANCANT